MSLASIIGAVVSFFLLLGAIAFGTDNYGSFFNLEGFLIVIGGSLAVSFMSFEASYVFEALWSIVDMVKKPDVTHDKLPQDLKKFIDWAYLAQRKGLMSLETASQEQAHDPMVKYGLELVSTGYKPEEVRRMMNISVEAAYERDTIPVTILRNMASNSPAFGMVGTLVGMVIMLSHLESDMSGIGQGLAIALLATLYGIAMARLFYLPAAEKKLQKAESVRFRNYLLAEGLWLLASNESPRLIQDKLNSFLAPELHFNIDSEIKSPALKPPSPQPKTEKKGPTLNVTAR